MNLNIRKGFVLPAWRVLALLLLSWGVALGESVFAGQKSPQNFNNPDVHILVDDFELHRITNLQRVLNRVKKFPEPVLVADKPWEGDRVQAWGSVIEETNGLLRMWYLSMNTERKTNEWDRGGFCYAESHDGFHWTKPNLGVVEFRGNKENNLFYSFAPDGKNAVDEALARRGAGLPALDESGKEIGVLNSADGITVVRDDASDPQQRYKLIANMQDHRMWARSFPGKYPDVTAEEIRQAQNVWGQYMDTSPDGIHWSRKPQRISSPVAGDYMMVTRDDRNNQWWLNERAKGKSPRNAALRTSKDLVHWSGAKIVFETDPQSEGDERFFEWHGGLTPFNYGDVNLGLLEKWCNAGFGNGCELVVNRNAQGDWHRIAPGQSFLDISPEGGFDHLLIYPTHNAPVRKGNDLLIYYTGGGANARADRGMPMSIGLATVKADRFAGLANSRGTDPGEMITNPLKSAHSQLELNLEPLDRARVRVAVGDDKDQIIPGFSYSDSQVEMNLEDVYARVRWKEKAFSELRDKPITLHIEIRGAILYSFRFLD